MTVPGELSHTILTGPPVPERFLSLEEIVRPFGTDRRGIVFLDGASRLELSYADLAGRMTYAAARLRQAGVGPGALVAMTITNDLESVLALLATWACGGTVVSLPPVPRKDNGWHARQFDPVLKAMGCAFLISDAADDAEPVGSDSRRIAKSELVVPAAGPASAGLPDVAVPDTALIQFTSGSVSTPKGVAISARALAIHIGAMTASRHYDDDADKLAYWLPLYHDMGLVAMFLAALAARMDQVIASPRSFAINSASWLTMLATEGATVTAAPNFAYRLAAAVPYRDPLDLSRLRVCISGGERLDWQTLLDFHATAGPMGCAWGTLSPSYGLAEGTVAVSTTPLGRGPRRGPGGYVSAGELLPGVEVRVPEGTLPGPIEIRGDSCLSGYHTSQGFEPFAGGEWFDTGDGGFAHDGELYVLGRRNEVLSMAGHNIFAEDVESVIHEACGESVRACAAFRNQGETGRFALMAEVNPRLVRDQDAALELARQIQLSVNETVGTRLSPVLVTRVGSIPRTSSGKVQRSKCRSLFQSGQITRRLIAELA
jgi:acyl-CoA synthetase (AMP-forming)/AMP-acid ligase II